MNKRLWVQLLDLKLFCDRCDSGHFVSPLCASVSPSAKTALPPTTSPSPGNSSVTVNIKKLLQGTKTQKSLDKQNGPSSQRAVLAQRYTVPDTLQNLWSRVAQPLGARIGFPASCGPRSPPPRLPQASQRPKTPNSQGWG